jgi:hypothetical protein
MTCEYILWHKKSLGGQRSGTVFKNFNKEHGPRINLATGVDQKDVEYD